MARQTMTKEMLEKRQAILKRSGTVAVETIEETVKAVEKMKQSVVGKSFSLFVPMGFEKADKAKKLVRGIASTEAVDSYGDIIRFDAMVEAFPAYMEFANIREMHGPSAVGTVKHYEFDKKAKATIIEAKIVDEQAWEKVVEGVYKGFSIGGKVIEAEPLMVKTQDKDGNEFDVWTGGIDVKKLELIEISLVDRPACPEALIESYKANNAGKEGGFVPDVAFVLKDLAKSETIIDKVLSHKEESMFEKVWGQVVNFFKSKDGVSLDDFSGDTAELKITKADLYELVKTFVEKAVEEVGAEEAPEVSETPKAPEAEEKQSEDAPNQEEQEAPKDEAPENQEEAPKSEEGQEEASASEADKADAPDFQKMIADGFATIQKSLESKIQAQSEEIANLKKSMNEKDEVINTMLKKAGFSVQRETNKKKDESVFKGLLS